MGLQRTELWPTCRWALEWGATLAGSAWMRTADWTAEFRSLTAVPFGADEVAAVASDQTVLIIGARV